jgi:hypothetical protein
MLEGARNRLFCDEMAYRDVEPFSDSHECWLDIAFQHLGITGVSGIHCQSNTERIESVVPSYDRFVIVVPQALKRLLLTQFVANKATDSVVSGITQAHNFVKDVLQLFKLLFRTKKTVLVDPITLLPLLNEKISYQAGQNKSYDCRNYRCDKCAHAASSL